MLGNVVLMRLVISIMDTLVPGAPGVCGGGGGGWLAMSGTFLGVGTCCTMDDSPANGGDSILPTTLAPRDPLLSLEFPLLPLSEGGGLNFLMSVGELSLLAVSGAELSMLAMWSPGVLGLFTRRLAHRNFASQFL